MAKTLKNAFFIWLADKHVHLSTYIKYTLIGTRVRLQMFDTINYFP